MFKCVEFFNMKVFFFMLIIFYYFKLINIDLIWNFKVVLKKKYLFWED